MPEQVRWTRFDGRGGDVVEHSLRVPRAGYVVPGAVWSPADLGHPPGLVLLGHGGSGHKRAAQIVELAEWYAGVAGLTALAIDGPYHGDRVPAPLPPRVYQDRNVAEGVQVVAGRMVEDWRATIDAVAEAGLANPAHLAYVGTSMGARFGMAVVPALGDALRCAVLGKYGLQQSPAFPAELNPGPAVVELAGRIAGPLLFHVQWDDELFARDGQFALFEHFAGPDKQLLAQPGGHGDVTAAATRIWREFVAHHLGADGSGFRPS